MTEPEPPATPVPAPLAPPFSPLVGALVQVRASEQLENDSHPAVVKPLTIPTMSPPHVSTYRLVTRCRFTSLFPLEDFRFQRCASPRVSHVVTRQKIRLVH